MTLEGGKIKQFWQTTFVEEAETKGVTMKKNILILLLVTAVGVSVYSQSSLSGRYVTDDEDSIYQYFEFTSGSRVRIGLEFMGYTQRLSASYVIEDGAVIISSASGEEIELEIVDGNTLMGVGFGMDDVIFRKEGTVPRR
jgi:hypothetical protein